MAKLLLFLREGEVREELARLLERSGHEVLQSASPEASLEVLRDLRPQVLIAEESETLLGEALRLAPLLPVIVCLDRRDAQKALACLQKGAFECVPPPWTREALELPIRRALRQQGPGWRAVWPEPSRVRGWARAAGAVLGLGLLAWGGWALKGRLQERRAAAERPFSLALPYKHPSGLAWKDGLWGGDWYAQSIYRLGPDLSVQKVHPLPPDTPVALAFGDGSLWIAVAGGTWLKTLPGDGLRRLGTAKAPGPKTVGLCHDGLYFWSADAEAKTLSKHLPDERLTVLETFPYPGARPAALACGREVLWTLDEGAGALLRHPLARPETVSGREPLPEYASGMWRPTGLAHDGERFWSVAERREGEEGRLFRHPDPWR